MELKTLQDAMLFFSVPQNCIDFVVRLRWPNGVTCPTCGSSEVTWLPTRSLFQCKGRHPKRQFSVKVGTLLESSPIGLDKWLLIMWMLMNCRNGISSYEVARTIGITQKSAWFMLHRLRKAMVKEVPVLSGEVEADETYIGGKGKNKHTGKHGTGGRSMEVKRPVFGLVERGGNVVAVATSDTTSKTILPIISKHVSPGSTVFTDRFQAYASLTKRMPELTHRRIQHDEGVYVVGNRHTNTIENFWSLLKRTLRGTYVSVAPKHLMAYVTEMSFRFNHRQYPLESMRFTSALSGIEGKRLTWKELVGAN